MWLIYLQVYKHRCTHKRRKYREKKKREDIQDERYIYLMFHTLFQCQMKRNPNKCDDDDETPSTHVIQCQEWKAKWFYIFFFLLQTEGTKRLTQNSVIRLIILIKLNRSSFSMLWNWRVEILLLFWFFLLLIPYKRET